MSKGDVVYSPAGEQVVLVDIGHTVLVDTPLVRVWEVALDPGEVQPWHLHHNPYLVLSLEASDCRMDWLDGSKPRYLSEYVGGAVFRPTSPIHRLTNIGDNHYCNRLIELKDLGENLGLDSLDVDVGAGDRSVGGQEPTGAPETADERQPVLCGPWATVWTVSVPPKSTTHLASNPRLPHVLATVGAPSLRVDPSGGATYHERGPIELVNETDGACEWFVVELSYLKSVERPAAPLTKEKHD